MIGMIEAVGHVLQGPEHRAVARRLDRERDGIRSAIDWALQSDDAETAARLIQPLFSYWWSRGLLPMTYALAERASALPPASRLLPYASALLSGARGLAMFVIGRTDEAEPLLRRMLETATALGDARLRAYALLGLGWALASRAAGEACERLNNAAAIFRDLQDGWCLAMTVGTSGQLALAHGDHALATSLLLEALAATEAIDNDHVRAVVIDRLGLEALTAGDLTRARDRFAAAAALHARQLDYEGSSYGMSGLAGLALAQNKPEVAARLIGAASRARRIVGVSVWPGLQSTDVALNAAVSTALGPVPFAAAAAEGATCASRTPSAAGWPPPLPRRHRRPRPCLALRLWAARVAIVT
jgi:tetratricopeptide (TPR) repeat protein